MVCTRRPRLYVFNMAIPLILRINCTDYMDQAGLGLIRNLAGAGFPLFGMQMYHRLGNEWATSLLAFLALLLIPIPFVLARYGFRLRKKSPWASRHITAEAESGGHGDDAPVVTGEG